MSSNTEKFLLFWLDGNMKTSDHNIRIKKKLRSIIKNCKTFDDSLECRRKIEEISPKNRLILIVSGTLGQTFLVEIHHLQQLASVYVYCMDRDANKLWADKYTKVKDVITTEAELLDRIESDKVKRVTDERSICYNLYANTNGPSPSKSRLQEHFIYSLTLIDILLRLDVRPEKDNKFISDCKFTFKPYKLSSEIINTYVEKKAIWCYTRETPVHDTVYDALCEQNVNEMISCRLMIRSIYDQLKENQYSTSVKVYYAQIMRSKEVEYLQQSVHELLSTMTFLLTDTNHDRVKQKFENVKLEDWDCRVLFIIAIDQNVKASKPFAAIDKISAFIQEGEILFMIGSIFRLVEVDIRAKDATVRLELCSENDPQLQPISEDIRRVIGNVSEDERIDLRRFGDILRRLGKFDSAGQIYEELTHELNGTPLKDMYVTLATVNQQQNDHEESAKWFIKALEIQMKFDPENLIDIGVLDDRIGNAYFRNSNNEYALKYYKQAKSCFQQAKSENHLHMAHINSNIGSVNRRKKDYRKALEYFERALTIYEEYPSTNRLNVAKTHNEKAIVHHVLGEYEQALTHCQQSLRIRREIQSPEDTSLAGVYENMGDIYKTMNNFQEALRYYEKTVAIYRHLRLPHQKQLKKAELTKSRIANHISTQQHDILESNIF